MPANVSFISSDHPSFPAAVGVGMIAIKVGEQGYFPIYTKLSMRDLNDGRDIPASVIESAVAGSMFGWDVPAAHAALDHLHMQHLEEKLKARGYVLEELDEDNPYNQWMNSGSEP